MDRNECVHAAAVAQKLMASTVKWTPFVRCRTIDSSNRVTTSTESTVEWPFSSTTFWPGAVATLGTEKGQVVKRSVSQLHQSDAALTLVYGQVLW